MNSNRIQPNGFLGSFENTHRTTLIEIEQLEETLNHLRFEGKASIGRNLNQIRSSLDFFQSDLLKHMELEEQVLFPFVGSHIPKLESVIHLLVSEHDDFRRNFEDLRLFLNSVANEMSELDRSKMVQKIQETATYLVYLIKNHVRVESKSVYEVVNEELKPDEKRDLEETVAKFESKVERE